MAKKAYYIPTIEVVAVNTQRLMDLADPSNSQGENHDYGAPQRRNPAY